MKVMNLIETLRRKIESKRVDDIALYRNLLKRAESPRRGDDDALVDVCQRLNKSPEDVQADLDVLRRFSEANGIAVGLAEAEQVYRESEQAQAAHLAQTDRIITERKQAGAQLEAAQSEKWSRLSQVRHAASLAESLIGQRPDLLTDTPGWLAEQQRQRAEDAAAEQRHNAQVEADAEARVKAQHERFLDRVLDGNETIVLNSPQLEAELEKRKAERGLLAQGRRYTREFLANVLGGKARGETHDPQFQRELKAYRAELELREGQN
jgi:hypothetical protein